MAIINYVLVVSPSGYYPSSKIFSGEKTKRRQDNNQRACLVDEEVVRCCTTSVQNCSVVQWLMRSRW